ncbi:MAG TPA: NUDIX domain-containing protein, partial [Pseudonocardiaceae bacterium]
RLLVGIGLGCCLMGLRWRLNTIWPLAAVHAVALLGALPPWWPVLAAGLAGYGVLLLRAVPTVWMEDRPTVRVLCLDERNRVLLLRWHDPFDGTSLWDMPGGGIDPGETPLAAARRELREETGLSGNCVLDRQVWVLRDSYWNSKRFRGWEPFFLARTENPDQVNGAGREPFEVAHMTGHCWVDLAAATGLPGRVQPIDLPGIADRLLHEDGQRVR